MFSEPLHPEEYAQPGLRLSAAQDRTLRAWPKERIRPKSVALGVISLLAEVDALRAERDALAERVEALIAERDAARAWSRGWKEAAYGYCHDLRQATGAWADTLSEFQQASLERDALRAALAWAVEWMEAYEGECMPEWREWQQRGRRALGDGAAGAP